jgi:uncharacterized protein (DUF2267 family)
MDYEQFVASVEDAVGPDDAPVTLRTLADRLSAVQVRVAPVRLARDPAPTPPPDGPAVHVDVDEYRPRVGASPRRESAYRTPEVVVDTLLDVLGPEIFERRAAQSAEPEPVVETPQPAVQSRLPLSVFFGRVGPPAHVVDDVACRFADAVLETLAERISPVAVDGMVERLPTELRPVLAHATRIYPGTGKHTRLQRLLDHVAERDETCATIEAQPTRPVLSIRPASLSEAELLHLARSLALRLPPGYTVRWQHF